MNHEPLIDEADNAAAFITNEEGYDVAVLQRVLEKSPAGEPRITDADWQSLVKLINAAPAMLNALEALLDDHKRLFTEAHPHSTIDWSECEEVEAAQAAINNTTK